MVGVDCEERRSQLCKKMNQQIPLILTLQSNACFRHISVIENETIRAIYFTQQQECENEDYVYRLKMLPKNILDGYGFTPGTPDEKAHYKETLKLYATLSEWMDYFKGTKALDSELFFTDKVILKPRADFSRSVLNLAVELLPRCPELQENYSKPEDVWLDWELQALDTHFWTSGFLGGKATIRPSKEQMAKVNRDRANNLENNTLDWSKASTQELRLNAGLFVLADYVAREDKDFRCSAVFRDYTKQHRAWGKAVRSPILEYRTFEDGKLLPGGRNAKRKM